MIETAADDHEEKPSKSAAAFRTISEVADELDVAQHVLRFWESKFPQVKPLKRGGGRRYYRPEDVDTLKDIQALLYKEGYTIKGAQKLLRQKRAPLPRPPKAPEPSVHIEEAELIEPEPKREVRDLGGVIEELKDLRAQLGALLDGAE